VKKLWGRILSCPTLPEAPTKTVYRRGSVTFVSVLEFITASDASEAHLDTRQFGASIDMLDNAVITCPDELWSGSCKFWHVAYHALFIWIFYCPVR